MNNLGKCVISNNNLYPFFNNKLILIMYKVIGKKNRFEVYNEINRHIINPIYYFIREEIKNNLNV